MPALGAPSLSEPKSASPVPVLNASSAPSQLVSPMLQAQQTSSPPRRQEQSGGPHGAEAHPTRPFSPSEIGEPEPWAPSPPHAQPCGLLSADPVGAQRAEPPPPEAVARRGTGSPVLDELAKGRRAVLPRGGAAAHRRRGGRAPGGEADVGTVRLGGVIHHPLVSRDLAVVSDLPAGQHAVVRGGVGARACAGEKAQVSPRRAPPPSRPAEPLALPFPSQVPGGQLAGPRHRLDDTPVGSPGAGAGAGAARPSRPGAPTRPGEQRGRGLTTLALCVVAKEAVGQPDREGEAVVGDEGTQVGDVHHVVDAGLVHLQPVLLVGQRHHLSVDLHLRPRHLGSGKASGAQAGGPGWRRACLVAGWCAAPLGTPASPRHPHATCKAGGGVSALPSPSPSSFSASPGRSLVLTNPRGKAARTPSSESPGRAGRAPQAKGTTSSTRRVQIPARSPLSRGRASARDLCPGWRAGAWVREAKGSPNGL